MVFWRLGDFNGDSRPDIATYDRANDQWSVFLADGPTPDLLLTVTNGVGEQTQITYASMQDSAAYVRDVTATYPQRNLQDGTRLVREVRKDNGVGGFTSTTYTYGGAKTDLNGRGFLGFRWFTALDSVSQVTTRTEVSQAFPTVGMPTLIRATHANGREIKRAENTLASTITANASNSNPKAYFPRFTRTVETERELADINNAIVREVTTDPISYNTYGCETARTTTSVAGGQTFTESVATTYSNNATSWLLCRPTRVTVTRGAPGFSNVPRRRDMTYTTQGELATEVVETADTTTRLKSTTTLNRHAGTGVVTSRVLSWTEVNTSTPAWSEDGTARTRTLETLVFDSRYRYPTNVTNALNQSETRAYDPRTGQVTSLTGPNAITTFWQYDGWGRRLRESRADGTYTTSTYTQCSSGCGTAKVLVTTQTFNGSNQQISVPSVNYLDALGRPVRWQSWAFDGQERNGERLFDAKGRLQSKTRTRFSTEPAVQTTYLYDDLGRTTEVNDPTTGRTTISHNGLTTTFTNSKNQTRTEIRNALGSLRTVTDANGKLTTYTYEPFGNLATVTDPLGNRIQVTYDKLGRKTQLRDPNLGTWNYVVNALGEVRSQTDAKVQTLKFRFDALGRLIHRLGPDLDHRWTYDTATKGVGKLAEATTHTGTGAVDYRRLHAYDSLGRPQRTTVRLDLDFVTESTYDGNGRVNRVDHIRRAVGATSGGQTVGVDYAYTSTGYLGQMRRSDGAILWTVSEQDALDRVRRQSHGNGVVTRRDFHAQRGLLETIRAGQLAGAEPDGTAQNDTYTYDILGNLDSRSQLNSTGGLITENYGYDNLNRLTSSQVVGRGAVAITYNDIGNITSKTGVGTYTYPASGSTSVRPQAVSSITGTVANIANPAFGYDANGNLTSGLGRTVTWTSFNYPLSITKASGAGPGAAGTGISTHAFVYGPEYQRIRQTITVSGGPIPGTTAHTYAGAIERETRTADNTTHVRTFLPQGVVLVDRYTDSAANITAAPTQRQIRYYQKDRLGSTVAVLDEAGGVLERQFYDPWGKRRNGDGSDSDTLRSLDHRYGYTEHEMLDAVGLVHMNGRVYDPLLGRFMSADPTVPDPSDGQNFNRYTYVLNNPYAYTDPSGFAQVRLVDLPGGLGGGSSTGLTGGFGSLSWQLSMIAMQTIPDLFGRTHESEQECINRGGMNCYHLSSFCQVTKACLTSGSSNTSEQEAPQREQILERVVINGECLSARCQVSKALIAGAEKVEAFGTDAWERAALFPVTALSWTAGDFLRQLGVTIRDPNAINVGLLALSARGPVGKAGGNVPGALAKGAPAARWRPGVSPHAPTRAGNAPSDRTVTRREWKNEAASPTRGDYSAADMERMRQGLPPQRYNPDKGGIESMERSHEPVPRRDGGTETVPRWPQEHAAVDPMRRPGY
ncbi:MAG: RHS repeat-associated core domain-containing protein [Burkholderiaceae bacterium]|nr:RHS repeat-associated core domain-containing protein [Burkholderiaceae bacterium]